MIEITLQSYAFSLKSSASDPLFCVFLGNKARILAQNEKKSQKSLVVSEKVRNFAPAIQKSSESRHQDYMMS